MSGSDEMFKEFDPRYYVNPYNLYDPSTPHGREPLSPRDDMAEVESGGTMTGWPRMIAIGLILGFIILIGA